MRRRLTISSLLSVSSLLLSAVLLQPACLAAAQHSSPGQATRPAVNDVTPSAKAPFILLAQQKPGALNVSPNKASALLPNGATSISESYEDWTVDCRIVDEQKRCLLSQSQGNNQTGQRIFAIEMNPPQGGKTEGRILMPFGVNLDSGAVLKLDGNDLGKGLRFSTCVPQGCLLPFSFPAVATDAMRKGSKLIVSSLNLSNGEPISFNISLAGFNAALDRMVQLAK